MNIFSVLKKKKVERTFYLALLLKPYRLGAILFEKTEKTLNILSTKESTLTKQIDDLSTEDLVRISDDVISFVEGSLPPGEQVEQTIFAVPTDWHENGKIKKEYLHRFKQLCTELSLTPIGFIISIEAIVHALQKKEGIAVSSIFVEIAHDQVTLYIVRNGNIIQTIKDTVKHHHIVETVEKLLSEVTALDVLPPKIILLDYEGAESVQQKFVSHDWKKQLPFMHLPQVVVLEKGFENEAVIHGVATQMESQVTHELQSPEVGAQEQADDVDGEPMVAASEFGFVEDADVKEAVPESIQNDNIEEILEAEAEEVNGTTQPDSEAEIIQKAENQDKQVEYQDTLVTRIQNLNPLIHIKNIKFSSKTLMSLPKKIVQRMTIKGWGILAVVLLLIGAGIYGYYAYFLKAEVIVFADKKTFDHVMDITLSPEQSTSAEEKNLNLNVVDISVSGDASKETTGKKETGEKAKGEVIIYNKTEDAIQFSKGAIIATNNLEFILTQDVKIASTSSFSTSFSSAKGSIEASKFGKEYNLSSGTNFTVNKQSTSDYFAKNESAFSGGTKKEIRVVGAKDKTDLENTILKELTKKAQEQGRTKAASDAIVLPQALSYEFAEEKMSKKEGEEANSVSLTATVNFKIGSYTNKDVNTVVNVLARKEIPVTYVMIPGDSDISITDIKLDEDNIATGKLQAHAAYMPQIDLSVVNNEIVGKGIKNAEETIRKKSGITDVNIKMNQLPLLPSILPLNKKNITIIVKSDG